MLKACVDLGGSISGEHGIGIDKREAMLWLFDAATLRQFRKIKRIFDPDNLCNPDKLIPADDQALKAEVAAPPNESPVGTKILDHDVENFTVTAEAAISVEELRGLLASKNQKVLFEGRGTLAEILGENRPQEPRIRDQILGMSVLFSDGTTGRFGGKVMKNVAGYDVAKLFLGSRGSLGIIRSVTLKTYPLQYSVTVRESREESVSPNAGARKVMEKIKKGLDT